MFCIEEGEDNSPSLQRRKRPLSMVLEEDPTTPGEVPSWEKDPLQNATEDIPNTLDTNQDTATTGKRTRRVGISYQHPPPLISSHDDTPASPTRSHRRLFATFPQRKISENTMKLRRQGTESSEGTDSEAEGDLLVSRLKDTATKLNLKTRRESYLTWQAKYADDPRNLAEVKVVAEVDDRLTKERKDKMDNDLRWIREQLVDLRHQDRSLARQLLGIRQELSSLRLAVSCEEHRELLEEAQDEMEELRELSRFDDCPIDVLSSSPLRQIGVTKMNLSSRRFSTC